MDDGLPLDTNAMSAGDPAAAGALDLGAQAAPQEKPRIKTPEEAAKLKPGTTFIGPDDKERVVPYKVSHPHEIADVPDGADFMGPDGKLRQKPKYEGIDFTAQALYDMGVNDKERKKALERSYPGKVRDDPSGGFYVEDDNGVSRKPGRGLSKITGGVASAAAPTILSVLGALGGGALGTVEPVGGNIAGAAAGGAGGAMLGQSFNDMIMGLSGTYDRSRGEEATEMALSGMGGAAGAGVGRGISTVVPSLKSGLSAASAAAPGAARSFLGAGKEDLQMASSLAEKGVAVPPSAWAKEAPHLQNVVEVFDPAFHTNQPLLESATAHYEKSAGEILRTMGIKDPGSLTKPLTDVPTKEAGEAVMRRTLGELAASDEKMQAALAAKKAAAEAGAPEAQAQRETVLKAAEEARTAAQKVIDAGYRDIDADIKVGMKVANAGMNSGDLWGAVGQKLAAVRKAVGERMKVMVAAADQAAGGHLPNIEGLPHTAEAFLQQVPPDFESRYPNIVKKLRDLAGVKDEKTGEWIKEPHQPTFGELHNLRSDFRANVDWNSLTHDVREGTYKFFAGKVDSILHGINETEEVAAKVEPRSFEDFTKDLPKASASGLSPNDPKVQRVVSGIDPLISDMEKRFPSLAKNLRDIRNQLRATNDNVDIDDVWDRLDQSLSLIEKNAGKSELTERLSKMLEDVGGIQDAPYLQHMKNQADINGAYKMYKETLESLADPNASWRKHTPDKQMLYSLEQPYEGRMGNPIYEHAEKTAWQEGAKVLRDRLGGGRQAALKEAARLLDDADKFYTENIKLFNAQQVKAVMRGLESGEPADPANLYNVVVKSGQTELTQKIKEKVGPNLWAGVKAADMTAMLDAAKTLNPGEVDGKKFAHEVLSRDRDNVLDVVHGTAMAEKLREQARRFGMLDGTLEIPTRPNDTALQVLARARQAEELAKAEAKRDPLAALDKEMDKIQKEHTREQAKARLERRNDPLGFLYNPSLGATEAVDKILGKEDLILAAAARFGEQSPEFEMLRQVWAKRLLTSSTMRADKALAGISPEIQQLMFPGVTLNQAKTLAKEMEFLIGGVKKDGSGSSMSAFAKVEHPASRAVLAAGGFYLGGPIGAGIGGLVVPPVARMALGTYYATMRKLMTSPALLRWLEKGLNGSAADREQVRQTISAVLQKGGAVGAGAGEAAVQESGPPQ